MTQTPHQISRVNQLDAELLDQELQSGLQFNLSNALTPIIGIQYHPELSLILRSLILFLSLNRSVSYGSQLQNLRWSSFEPTLGCEKSGWRSTPRALSQTQIKAYILLDILPFYLHGRLRDYMLTSTWADCPPAPSISSLFSSTIDRSRRKRYWCRFAWDLSTILERICSSCKLAHFLIFLYDGRYRSILERFLGIRLVYASSATLRNVSFEFLNRQLVWESITDFLLFILPFINVRRLKLRLLQARSTLIKTLTRSSDSSLPDITTVHKPTTGPYSHLPHTACPICTSKLTNPTTSLAVANANDPLGGFPVLPSSTDSSVKVAYEVGCCGGLYCYHCLVSEIINWRESSLDRRWECWRCGNVVLSIQRWDGQKKMNH
ncbi:hypothetical protein CROQUDRAFT_669040 [Cronartium quercuum f. sp. fusiforme G11]|uniref:RING-type E3 ubiquitin transferase (cysteine targeting) n=1 Tax=Cronartium quercuum f. sp. fusiforme G11 TaxID=708437 RepID=A0A9P6TEU0_9BASI|nr:hypothetical protein CROQUDRAFT_669040 [Cronartium quercuum f. sp. fusiforme G11]